MWLEYQLLEPKMAEAVPSDHGSGCKGRPSIELDVDNVKHLLSLGFSKSKVAGILGISRKTLYNKIAPFPNPDDFKKHSAITEAQLDTTVQRIKEEYPNDGEIMVAGDLLKQGIRVQCAKLRENIHHIDPQGVVRKSVAVRRREYHTKGPNEVWHIDGHHKLIK